MKLILFLIFMCWLMVMCSCSKSEMIEERSQVHMMTDFYDSDTVLIDTREHFYTGVNDSVYWFSGSELMKFKNYKPILRGCERDGFQRMRYEFNSIGKPFIYKY